MLTSTNDKVVLILGASSDIGRAAAKLFAREWERSWLRRAATIDLQSLKEELVAEQREITVRSADVCQFRDMQQLAQQTLEGFGRESICSSMQAEPIFLIDPCNASTLDYGIR